jgi:hypothetical protein
MVFADMGYQCVAKHTENTGKNRVSHVAVRTGKRRTLGPSRQAWILDQIERLTAQVSTLFALANLWMARLSSSESRFCYLRLACSGHPWASYLMPRRHTAAC